MKVEILFPEHCNLFADLANMRYLQKCLPEAEFISTPINQPPRFLSQPMNLVYMGPMTEHIQEAVIDRFMPYKQEIAAQIEMGTPFLFTGNALEVLGRYIETDEGKKIPALGILDLWAKRNLFERHNSECEGEFMGHKIMGFKSQFTMCYPKTEEQGLFPVLRGMGMNMESKVEGVRIKNFFGTYLIGPLLVLNPEFTRYLLSVMGKKDAPLAFEEAVKAAYDKRLADFERNVPKDVAKYKYM